MIIYVFEVEGHSYWKCEGIEFDTPFIVLSSCLDRYKASQRVNMITLIMLYLLKSLVERFYTARHQIFYKY